MNTDNSNELPVALDALLGVIARHVANGEYERVDLYDYRYSLFQDTALVIESLNRQVAEKSNGQYSVKSADAQWFADGPMGRAIFCARVDKTGEERLFCVFGAAQGFWYSDRVTEEQYQRRIASMSERL